MSELAYAWVLTSSLELVLRAAAAAWLVACTALAAHALACRVAPRSRLLDRAVAVLICGFWLATLGFHALAFLRAYSLLAALLACGVLGAATLALSPATPRALSRDLRALRRIARRAFRGPQRLWNACFWICAAPVLLRPWLLIPNGWDSLTYHALKAALWVQHAGALPMHAPGTWNVHRPRWGGAEVMLSWAMLPFHSDLLAAGSEVLHWLGLGVVLFALARALGARPAAAGAAAGFYLSVPTLRLLVGAGYSELLACLCFAAGCLFGVRYLGERRAGQLVLACAAIGLAVGMKLSFVRASVALLGVLLVYTALRRPTDAGLPRALGTAVTATAAVIAPWALRTAAEEGLPLSPMPIEVLGLPLGRASREIEWVMRRPELLADPLRELHVLGAVFGSPASDGETLTLFALLPVLAALALLATRARAFSLPVWILVLAALADVATYFSADLASVRLRWPATSSRFLLAVLLISTAISVLWGRTHPRFGRVYVGALRACTLILLLSYAALGWSRASAAAASGLLVAAGIYAWSWGAVARRARSRRLRIGLRAALFAALLVALSAVRDELRYVLMRDDYTVRRNATFWVDAARAVDDPTRVRHIAVTGGPSQDMDRWFAYPFLGRRLQNQLLYVTPLADGSIGHYGDAGALAEFAARSDPKRWLARLRKAAVTHVVTFDPISVERLIIDRNPQLFRQLSPRALTAFGLFELLPKAIH